MMECKSKMESTESEIQVESKDEKRATEVSLQEKRLEEKTSKLCFKRRKKAAKAPTPTAGSEAAAVAKKRPPKTETEASDQPRPAGGAWASIKRLVTGKKKSDSSKQKTLEAKEQPEINAEDVEPGKKKAKSRLKIPCLKFSRRGKRKSHSKIIEDSSCSIKVQGEAESLSIKTPTQSEEQAPETKRTPQVKEDDSQKEGGGEGCAPGVSNSLTSAEKVISVELGLDKGHAAGKTGTVVLETAEEKPSVLPPPETPPETSPRKEAPAVSDGHPSVAPPSVSPKSPPSVASDVPPSITPDAPLSVAPEAPPSVTPEALPSVAPEAPPSVSPEAPPSVSPEAPPSVAPEAPPSVAPEAPPPVAPGAPPSIEEVRKESPESEPNWKVQESPDVAATESQPEEGSESSQESDFKENELDAEEAKPEESRRMEPIAIIITDTEISEFDAKKSKNVPKQFLIAAENEQVGVFANDNGFEGRTSEQYETLLTETASSLVKNAIQLSIEQLVNEMVADDNKINNLVQ
ncbi:A-kinase anchor protein 5 isoform X1 [Suncus etruscus]|uniref:A-kinase anchor protein 5 isoform X1 n=1 Tax=Suncus etruscus TaxID=109475 RepID=UPI00210FE580|nr:A-kinase anchor protein 5 isoform X1 [Suncus etruscus]